ncbi:hypothetical protein [Azospirillum himalayense]|uniref:Plasmid replication protein n=1 Tax=Azospirillum himalayense TaxID=654847 RepID=A0ABW0G9R5_9PROT
MAQTSTKLTNSASTGPDAVQLLLFETENLAVQQGEPRRTNAFGLWDTAPRFFFGDDMVETPIDRHFQAGGRSYRLTINPVSLRLRSDGNDDDGVRDDKSRWKVVMPGNREQIVEEVVRLIATRRARLSLDKHDEIVLRFSLHEIQKELAKVNKTLSHYEIRDALTILHKSVVEVTVDDGTKEAVLSSSAFPTLHFGTKKMKGQAGVNGGTMAYLKFNDLVASDIRNLRYRMVSYETLICLPPVGRWIYKMLSWYYEAGNLDEPIVINARSIIRDSGMTERSRFRDTLSTIRDSLAAVQDAGIIEPFELERQVQGRSIDDEIYTLTPSAAFRAEIEMARVAKAQAEDTLAQMGGTPHGPFQRVDRLAGTRLRRDRASRAVEKPVPLLERDA